MHEVAKKCKFEPSKIVQVVCVRGNINVVLDDDVVQEIPEGQDMIVEFSEVRDDILNDGNDQGSLSPTLSPTSIAGLEMKLIF